ncbi:MAG: acyl-CoA dehydrogenase family protein [Syntrophales bacterium]
MDFRLTPEQETLKKEFEDFFAEEAKRAPEGWTGRTAAAADSDENWAYHRSVAEKLAQKGWLSLPWPKEYGGREHSYLEQLIFNEVRAYHGVPGVDNGPYIVAPSIIEHGSKELKQKWLPKMARAEITWCQGWSEPNAGSDLASLTTRAVEDGDDFVINGQKIWTTGAHRADHIFFLARTDPSAPKHKGITYFISEIDKPGITIRPLLFINRKRKYNEVFFDNFRVPKKNVVGQVNQGWYVTMAGINFERSTVGAIADLRREFRWLIEFCKGTNRNNRPLAKDPLIRSKLAQLAIEIDTVRQWAYYVSWLQSKGQNVPAESSVSKWFSSELAVRFANTAVEIMGLYGTLRQKSKYAMIQGKFEDLCQYSLGLTIAAGTTEIMKNIVARMKLKLPR